MTGRYKTYQEYADSQVDWIGRTPNHWSVKRLKFIFDIKKRIAGQLGFDVLSITQKGIVVKDIESGDGQLSMDYSKYQLVFNGDFAMNHMDLLTGYVDISDFNGVTSPDYRVFTIKDKTLFFDRYYLYLLQMCYKQKIFFPLGQGSAHLGRWRLPTEAFNEVEYPHPDYLEQQKIANFLDHETAKIDTLITKQEKLIELLKEKRQAVISHAVTKGLNPDAPMKDSGVEWLGEVPEHWVVCCLKHIKGENKGSFVDGPFGSNLKSEHFVDNGDVYVIESNFATTGLLDTAKLKTISTEHFETISRSETTEGAIIIAKIGARYGMNSVMPALDKKAVVSGNSLSLKVNEQAMNVQYCHHLLTHLKQEGAMDDGVNVTAQPALSLGQLNNLPFLRPSKEEQQAIVDFIQQQEKSLSSLILNAERMIELSTERKIALISAAVTGKIDVRDWDTQGVQG
ncbi:restriction endonuclease subunit S [Vibrio vulnificus]|nr:restriction endonuclease subunit S [Vibrio vulnificus]